VTYYSPERVFIYVDFQKGGLSLTVFTNGQDLPGVSGFGYERAGAKWRRAIIKDETQLETIMPTLERSHKLMKDAIKNNEATGWYAPMGEETE